MKMEKRTVSAGPVDVDGLRISAEADLSAMEHSGGFFISVRPVLLSVETEYGTYIFCLKNDEKKE